METEQKKKNVLTKGGGPEFSSDVTEALQERTDTV